MLFTILVPAMDGFLLCRIMNNLLTYRFSKKTRYIPGLIAFTILMLRLYLFRNVENSGLYTASKAAANLVILLSMLYFYKDSLKKKLSSIFLFYLIMIIVEGFIICALLIISRGQPFYMLIQDDVIQRLCTYFSKILTFYLIESICHKLYRLEYFTLSYTKELAFIVGYNIILFFVMLYLLVSESMDNCANNELLLMIAVNVFFMSILSSLLIIKVAQRSKKELQYQLELQQMELEHKSNNDMAELVGRMRSFRHDINNHLGVMSGLLEQAQYEDLEQYLTGLTTTMSPLNRFVLLENTALSALINNKSTKAYMNKIEFVTTITVETLPLTDIDLCALLGNMLDNAIEACLMLNENRYVHLSITSKGSQYRISCRNPYETEPLKKGHRFLTNKENSEIHGIGLENIQHIVEKYNGELEIDCQNHIFTIEAMIQA